ncbi:HMG box domain-containing protein [Trichonephila clavata]|uniref:HMG box domain-containing protein n=1 Tax=Trichonephila clavata TaxID=2740835 RepID=A0A8X6L791_TRICU|nr:HMG box domain-containing protein [Trichonephila clavata]
MTEIDSRSNNRSVKGSIKARSCSYSSDGCNLLQCNSDNLEPSLTDLILKPKSNKIARPPNAFMLFAREHRKALASKYPNHNNKNISSLLGKCWRNVDESTKEKYYKKAKMLEELHKQQYPGYVYSPRIARIQKMARKKKNMEKCDSNASSEKDIPLEPVESIQHPNQGVEKSAEWESKFEAKQSSPGYVPNNPQFFPDPEHVVTGSEEPNSTETNSPMILPENYSFPNCPPWNIPQVPMPYTSRCPDEYEMHAGMYMENYYPSNMQSSMCGYNVWDKHRDNPYEPPLSPNWNPNRAGFTSCRNECASIHSQRELSSFPHLPTQSEFKNSCCHHDVTMPYGTSSSLPHAHGPHRENSMAFCNWPRPYMPRKAPNAYSPCFYQNIDYCYTQPPESIKNYYPRFPYPTQPREYGYPPPAYDGRLVNRREKAESNIASQITESVFQGVEQYNTEPSDTEILNVVDVDETEDISQNNDVVGTESVKLEEEQSLTNNAVI